MLLEDLRRDVHRIPIERELGCLGWEFNPKPLKIVPVLHEQPQRLRMLCAHAVAVAISSQCVNASG